MHILIEYLNYLFSMNLKLGKSFPLLKFKPNFLQPLPVHPPPQTTPLLPKNPPILTFTNLLTIDYNLSQLIHQTKHKISQYLKSVPTHNITIIK